MGLGFGELIVVLLIVILFFGGKKLPQLGSSLGESLKNFKKGLKEEDPQSKDKNQDS
jgi:sec-independent protein translocase protein TatA